MGKTVVQNKIDHGQIVDFPISKIIGLEDRLDNIVQPDPYVHPTQDPIDTGALSGAQVVSRISVNSLGHTENISVRSLTPSSIGAQPVGSYETLSNKSTSTSLGTSNSLYPTQNAVKTYVDNRTSGYVASTRSIATGSGLTGGGNLSANRTIAVDGTVLRTNSSAQRKTGTLTIFRGSNSGEVQYMGWDYPDNSGEDYNLRLFSDGRDDNINYYFKQKCVTGDNDVRMNMPVIGFEDTVTTIGDYTYPKGTLGIETYYNSQTDPPQRHPLVLYVAGDSAFNGTIRTKTPGSNNISNEAWRLGAASGNADNTVNTIIRVQINGNEYNLLARSV